MIELPELTLHTNGVFNSTHHLENYEGDCLRTHGHSWFVDIWITGKPEQLNSLGILVDFKDIGSLIKSIDHQNLNEIFDFNPTCENITIWFYKTLKGKYSDFGFWIRVYENYVDKKSYVEIGDKPPKCA